MNYDDETLREINDNADLLAYAQQTLDLEQRGNDYFAHCPLHRDDTPSLSFTPSKNSYYCFSCGASGGMIGYLMDFEEMEKKNAANTTSDFDENFYGDETYDPSELDIDGFDDLSMDDDYNNM